MKSITDTLLNYEEIFRDNLKVSNPALLKTGALGTLVNIFANIKYDNAIYYNKLLRELNPATATEFNSLLFHSSILNYNITFGTPASMQISILIPEFRLRDTEIVTYNIDRSTPFTDATQLSYTLEDDIKIYVNNTVLSAKAYSDTDVKILEVSRVENPVAPGTYMFMVDYNSIKQYKRDFYKFNVPFYEIGENHNFTVDIPAIDDIYQINAWIRRGADKLEPIEIDKLLNTSTVNVKQIENIKQMKVKYNKFNASQFDDNLYLKMNENQLIFTIGDGINGTKLDEGDQIIIETKLTKGAAGNVSSAEINLEDILVESEDEGGYKTASKSNVKVLSLTGGELGLDIADIEDIKQEMIKKSSVRGSITTINDFETMYTIDYGKPFIDPKFFNSQNHIFIYNILRDNNQRIVNTTTLNIREDEFKNKLFFPTTTYKGIELISPFYYKKKFNQYTAFMVQPEIKIQLKNKLNTDKLLKLKNSITLLITYDYFEQKSRIEIQNYNPLYTYKFESNLFKMDLNVHNEFKQEINQRFLDEYCILEDFLKDITINIFNNNQLVLSFDSISKYTQLVKKQDHYYYTQLDNLQTTNESRYVLHIPFLDTNYMRNTNSNIFFSKLNKYFRTEQDKNDISFNVGVTQSFYNTIHVEDKYRKFIIETNINGNLLTTRNSIVIDLIIDKNKFILSDYETIETVEYDMKEIIYKTLRQAEGFETEFFETLLERKLTDMFNMIDNVDVLSPKVFITNSANIIYDKMDNALNLSELSLFDIVDFIPPYFFFDYNEIILNFNIR